MAKMYPKNIELYNPEPSEKRVYDALQKQLDDHVEVYYSISWTTIQGGKRVTSEADFLVFDPRHGYLVIEVKGGAGIKVENNEWYLEYKDGFGGRKLDCSPYEQAEKSMYYFKDYFKEQYRFQFGGTYGAMVCFPDFVVENASELSHRPAELTIDFSDMDNLSEKIRKAFIFWKRKNNAIVNFSNEQKEQFHRLINKRIQISAACGALIKYQAPQFEIINRVQNNFVYFLRNYRRFFVNGGAGTGKTWVALKFVEEYRKANLKVLLTCINPHLINFFKEKLGDYPNVDILSFNDLLLKNKVIKSDENIYEVDLLDRVIKATKKKYDAIVIDEAQDFNVESAMAITQFLVDENKSVLNVFFDKTQNIFDRDFEDGFGITNPPFYLRENLRNTSSIYKWATANTEFETDVITNPIEGTDPVQQEFTSIDNCINRISLILSELIENEGVMNTQIVVLVDDEYSNLFNVENIAKWKLVKETSSENDIRFYTVSEYKGLEADVVIYVHKKNNNKSVNYVAYTRARYFLYDLVIK